MSKVAEVFESMEYGPAPENAKLALEWLESMDRRFHHFIDGKWVPGFGEERLECSNPATGEILGSVLQGTEADIDRAVEAARDALGPWKKLSGHARARYLYALARGIQKRARLFAVLETMDNGKPVRESRDLDIPLVARHFYHHAGWAQLLNTEMPGYDPVGVVGQIIPWNFPMLMLAWKIAPALACGNTVVLKPAESTPLTALLFADLCRDIGLPPGVVNIVTGDGRTGAALVAHPDVDKIAFTGSTEVGRILRTETAGTGKKLSLELGGKSPFLVYEDADLDSVVEGVVDAIWFNQGQVCCAGSRILVQEGIASALETKLRARMETLRMGDPLDKSNDMGAIVDQAQLEKIRGLVEQGREEGARVWQPSWTVPEEGTFYPPTLCTGCSPSSTLAQVEIFGPVVVLMTFRTPEESVQLANDTRYGLAASLWTENINLALDVAPKLKAGTVWVNCTNLFDAAAGFGGYRESGFGREGGKEGLFEYVQPGWLKKGSREKPLGPKPSEASGIVLTEDGQGDDGLEASGSLPPVDRTAKLYIGGKQVRGDGDYSLLVRGKDGSPVGEVPRGNRKDIRNAVEAAHAGAKGWTPRTSHNRAQILYYWAENLAARSEEFRLRLQEVTGIRRRDAGKEVDAAVRRLFGFAAWADKYDGMVHHTPFRNVTLAMPEPIGVMGLVCPEEAPLLGFVSTVAPLVAMGNAVVAIPSERWPLLATDLYQVIETSDVPAGVINIVTGLREEVVPTLAAHDNVDGIWYFGSAEGSEEVERLSTGNMKRTWVSRGRHFDWWNDAETGGEPFLREAIQWKNIWVPYGE
ncbi:MAG: aldehyde dehydrogenase family protein [Gemmatimonadetes bacterium]|nr:aldehyde dehydrogenase family protein [Gemmatimonadota bacterium]